MFPRVSAARCQSWEGRLGGQVDVDDDDWFFTGYVYPVSWTRCVFGEQHQSRTDASYLSVACFDFSFAR
jgi:hypothetical protein